MAFNSLAYLFFLPAVFAAYWLLGRSGRHWQNVLLLAASYFFYGWWDWRFLGLLLVSTVVDYGVGIFLEKTDDEPARRRLLTVSLVVNLGMLGFFKYFDFFAESFAALAAQLGWKVDPFTLRIILPVGISFYTFQTLSYTIDVYRRNIPATRNFLALATFVAFFPQLVAGPIERASRLLPQFLQNRTFAYAQAASGCRLILLGLFKKMVIADNMAPIVGTVFDAPGGQNAWTVALGAICFAFQIYGDFSGYSDLAMGSARLLGFELMQNFRTPYFAASIREFWQRWHISLSTWFRDYLYIPLGGNRCSRGRHMTNLLLSFGVSGLWHGANWTFVLWGLWHGLLAAGESLSGFRAPAGGLKRIISGVPVFAFVCLGWIFFRADGVQTAFALLGKLGNLSGGFATLAGALPGNEKTGALGFTLLFFLALEWRTGTREPMQAVAALPGLWRWAFYFLLLLFILLLGVFDNAPQFIYFQF